ncbi:MAG: hypothetical protein IJ060_10735 [Oscillospiraceae bacterium]|nr:hypothetical protein [Oscillospiraceae bacterium]
MNRIKKAALCMAALPMMLSAACGTEAEPASTAEQTSSQTSATTTTTPVTTTTTTTSSTATTTTTTTTTVTTTTTTTAVTTTTAALPPNTARTDFTRSEEFEALLAETAFVGDSICSGLSVYHCLPEDHVIAKGSVGARSVLDNKFSFHGAEVGVPYALSVVKPKYVVFSMGMNDIRMTTAEQYCANYERLLDTVQSVIPDAKLFVASITPVSSDSTFTENSHIDAYNTAIREYLAATGKGYGYLDISVYLKDASNGLSAEYNGSDGIHLMPAAYQAILYAVCEQLTDAGYTG